MPIVDVVLALLIVGVAAWLLNGYAKMPGNVGKILNVVLALIIVGIALWDINVYIPMAGSIKAILNITVVVATCVGVLKAFDLWSPVVRMWHRLASRASHETNG
jgi:predicted membrane protein